MRKLHVINTGFFKLDGGAMFGVVPKQIWQKTNPADANNLCSWAMRSLLIEDESSVILIDNGLGNKQDEKFFSHLFLFGEDSLLSSLSKAGFSPEDISDNILTHLHFDHCGGSVIYTDDSKTSLKPQFPNADYWCHSSHWDWATNPNPREKSSFLKENILPLEKAGQLKFLDQTSNPFKGIDFLYVDGHTEKQTIPFIEYKGKTLVFVADLLPSVGHLPIPYLMSYDTRPLLTLQEKISFLNEAAEKEYVLFFQHDPEVECCTVQHTDKGVRVKDIFKLSEV